MAKLRPLEPMTEEERRSMAGKAQPAWMCLRCRAAHNATTRICGGCFEQHTPATSTGDREAAGEGSSPTVTTPRLEDATPAESMRRDYEVGNWDYLPWSRM